jgi:hypothetical protein
MVPPPLPARLLERLQGGPLHGRWAGVVAPLEVGANPSGLRAWAEAQGWAVWRTPPPPGQTGWLWLPAARQEVQGLPHDPGEVLVLSGADLCYTPEDWSAALPDQTETERAATFELSGGWPGALELARQRPGDREAYRQPQASVLLAAFLPPAELRQAARMLAVSPLV